LTQEQEQENAMRFDLLLRGGHVIDPKNGIDAPKDVAIADGKIAAVDSAIPAGQAAKVVDVAGLHVVPGLVDIHVHLYATAGNPDGWAGDWSILPDGFSFRSGVTTMMDVGSAGRRNFEDFRLRVLDRCATRTYALVNIVGVGMASPEAEHNIYDMDPRRTAALAKQHADKVVGIKTAHYQPPDWISVERAIEAGALANMPIMVDFGYFRRERPYYQLVGEKLRPGDISTHCFRGPVPCIGDDGKVLPYLYEARKRGVLFDLGHGAGSFVFGNVVPCIQQGFYPDTISTDLHVLSMNRGMLDMTTTMSKLLVLGMPIGEVIRRSTVTAAATIGHPEHGHLSVGAAADVAVLNLLKGSFGFMDSFGGTLRGEQRFFCELTLKDGKPVWDWNGRSGVDYRQMGDAVGIRPGEERVMPPA
jgi:dihydroorotase